MMFRRIPDSGGYRRYSWVTLMAVACALLSACSKPAETSPPPVEVTTVTVIPQSATVTEEYVGETEAANTAEIRPRISGVLEQQAVIEGSRVRKGDLLFVLDRRPYEVALARARASLAQTEANSQQSQRDLARMEQLSAQEVVSRQQLDTAQSRRDADRAAVQAAQAAARSAELDLGYSRILSPIDGVVSRAEVRVGGLVTAYSTLLTTVYETDPLYVNFSISEQRLLSLQQQLGRAPSQSGEAPPFQLVLADGSRYGEPAHLNFIDAAVDKATGTLAVRLQVSNAAGLLRPNQFMRVRVAAQQAESALLVPQRAVQQLQGKNYLWIIDSQGRAQQRDVVMGGRIGGDWWVQQGLQAGEVVAVDGVQRLKPGMAVQVKPLGGDTPAVRGAGA